MAIFHFAFDLQMFGFVEPHYIEQASWKYFARSIASSFLILTGFSLYLAARNGINWKSWVVREIKIVAAAFVITIATRIATPDHYIFFGILHHIAFASLACLVFVFLPAWLTFFAGCAAFWIGQNIELEILNHPFWFWTGLTQITPVSNDYVPVFPWWSASLIGVAVAKITFQLGWLDVLGRITINSKPARLLVILGQHSLLFYLLHQPVLVGLVGAYAYLTGRL